MRVYVANFGYQNIHWPTCKAESVITLQLSDDVRKFWLNNDRKGWQEWAAENETMHNGQPALPQVSSRWFNLLSLFRDTEDDIWLHRADDRLFWTISKNEAFAEVEIADPFGEKRKHWLWRKSVQPWSDTDKQGRGLHWKTIHPKAYDFLQTEATYQEVQEDRGYKEYAMALVEGSPRERWHALPDWKAREGKQTTGRSYSTIETTIYLAIKGIELVLENRTGC